MSFLRLSISLLLLGISFLRIIIKEVSFLTNFGIVGRNIDTTKVMRMRYHGSRYNKIRCRCNEIKCRNNVITTYYLVHIRKAYERKRIIIQQMTIHFAIFK